jgi:hypothetical protein
MRQEPSYPENHAPLILAKNIDAAPEIDKKNPDTDQ